MDKNQKKLKYQQLFLAELRSSAFGEKKLVEALLEMETKANMRKLANALKSIWKQTDESIKELESAFPAEEVKVPLPKPSPVISEIKIKPGFEPQRNKPMITRSEKRKKELNELRNLNVLSYEHLIEMVDSLKIEDVEEIITAAEKEERNDHLYLTKLAEKLLKNSELKKIQG